MNRGLTTEEAERGVRPTIQTKEEWDLMWLGSLEAQADAVMRTGSAFFSLSQQYGNKTYTFQEETKER